MGSDAAAVPGPGIGYTRHPHNTHVKSHSTSQRASPASRLTLTQLFDAFLNCYCH